MLKMMKFTEGLGGVSQLDSNYSTTSPPSCGPGPPSSWGKEELCVVWPKLAAAWPTLALTPATAAALTSC